MKSKRFFRYQLLFVVVLCMCVVYACACISCVSRSAYPLLSSVFCSSSSIWLLVAFQLCIPAALLLLSLYCLCHCFTVCCFSHFQLSLKRQKKNCLRKAFFEYNITTKLACLYNQRRGICTHHSKTLVQMRVCVCTSQQCPFPTNHTIPSSRPLRKVHLLLLRSHLRFTEISDSKHLLQTVWNTPRWAFTFRSQSKQLDHHVFAWMCQRSV